MPEFRYQGWTATNGALTGKEPEKLGWQAIYKIAATELDIPHQAGSESIKRT